MLPFVIDGEPPFGKYDTVFIPHIRRAVMEKRDQITAYALSRDEQGVYLEKAPQAFTLSLGGLTDDEREIILAGCLINYYKTH